MKTPFAAMRMHHPLSSSGSKTRMSPPIRSGTLPLRPGGGPSPPTPRVQQARGAGGLRVLVPSPPSHRRLDFDSPPPSLTRAPTPRSRPSGRASPFGMFAALVLAAASLHLVRFGNRHAALAAGGPPSPADFALLRGGRRGRGLATAAGPAPPPAHPRVYPAHPGGAAFGFVPGRRVEVQPAERTDVTQLYDRTSSNDVKVSGSMERRHFPRHETDPECVPMSPWQAESFPTCNGFHETGIESLVDNSLRLLSTSGSWRDAWRLKAPIAGQKDSVDNIIMKTIKNKHTFQDRYFEFSRVDSLAMEKLTSSPYVMNIYGHCGMSVMTERGGEQLGHVARRISSRERVKMAIKVAEGLVDVHGIGGGDNASLVHNDINLNNIFVGGNFRTPLLNDFNIAVLLMKDRRSGQACAFTGHYPNPQWKSPEEQVSPQGGSKGQLNEKVDIYAVGNLLFTFLTGKAPWGHLAKHHPEELPKIGRAKMTEGLVPPVPDEYLKSKDPYLRVLRQAMDMCFQFRPEDRPSAKELAQFLEEAKVEADQSDIEFGRKRRKRK